MHESEVKDGSADMRMLLIETHSPWESGDVDDFLDLARALLEAGLVVRLHLIQNGVIRLRGKATAALVRLREQFDASFQITSDDMSLDLRGLAHSVARDIGGVTDIDELVASMADPAVKTIWHS